MGKKDLVHIGRRSLWSGAVKTLCGLTFDPSSQPEGGWFTSPSPTCPACLRVEKGGK
jgi:hypothetical protein